MRKDKIVLSLKFNKRRISYGTGNNFVLSYICSYVNFQQILPQLIIGNLQGAATLVGDTTAVMLGSALDMSFLAYYDWRNLGTGSY